MTGRGVGPDERAAIEELNARFAWALDCGRFEDLHDVFTADAHYASGSTVREGSVAIIAGFTARTGVRTTRHGWSSLLLERVDDRTVRGRSSWYAFAANGPPPVPATPVYMVADFHDSYVWCPDDGWRIAERTIEPVFRDNKLAPA